MKILKSLLLPIAILVLALLPAGVEAQDLNIQTIAGGTQGTNDGLGASAQFNHPTGVAEDASGNIFVADQLNNSIREMTPSGSNWTVTTIAGGGTNGYQDGTNSGAKFSNPTGIVIDTNGNLFVSDQFNYVIREISPQGTNWVVTTIAGQARVGGQQDGTNSTFRNPTGLAIDSSNNIYVADEYNNAIRELTLQGTNWVASTIAGGVSGSLDGAGTNAQFNYPVGVAVDASGRVFVADQINSLIRMVAPQGGNWNVTTIAGQTTLGSSNGIGTNALFDSPTGIAVDTNGNLFVADEFNNSVRELTPSGSNWVVSTVAGGATNGLANGAGPAAEFYEPYGIATDRDGNVLVADSGNNAIRESVANGVISTNAVGSLEVTLLPSDVLTNNVQWQVDGGALQSSGATVTGLSTGTHTVSFTFASGWLTPASQTVTITASNLTTAVGAYTVAPDFTITAGVAPGDNGSVSGAGTFPEGTTNQLTATPNGGYEFIGWTGGASGTNNPLNVPVTGNLNITAYFAPAGSMEIILVTNGQGRISPNVAGKTLKAGQSYTLGATPLKGNVFTGWTGSITTNRTPLRIKLESSIVMEANFIPNPFIPLLGSYNGLFLPSGNVTIQDAGMIRNLAINQAGAYSGQLLIDGASRGISGKFDYAGQATNLVNRTAAQGGPITVHLDVNNSVNPAPQVTGTVSGTANGGAWTASLVADLAPKHIKGQTNYTVLVQPDTNSNPPLSSPGGDSYAAITDASATAHIAGSLADGTAFSESAPVSVDGYVPIYAKLYAGQGMLLGWINLNAGVTNSVGLTWIHPATRAGLFQAGFTNMVGTNQIFVSPWTNPPANLNLIQEFGVTPTFNDTGDLVVLPANVASNGKITGANANGSLNLHTGIFTVTVENNGTKETGRGVILPGYFNAGGGYVITKTNTGAILVQPY